MNNRSAQELLQPERLARELGPSIFSNSIFYHESMDSTNRFAKELAVEGAPEGTLVLVEEQTDGKGRRGRSWVSTGRENLLFSVLLRPALPAERVFSLTMILALSAAEAVRSLSGVAPAIKWPNDLYGGKRKLGGILTEFSVRDKEVEWVVLGLGLNVNSRPEGLAARATCVAEEAGMRVSRNQLLVEILKGLEAAYGEILADNVEPFFVRWNEACFILGEEVEIEAAGERIPGKALRIERDGALILETKDGALKRIVAGDVSLSLSS